MKAAMNDAPPRIVATEAVAGRAARKLYWRWLNSLGRFVVAAVVGKQLRYRVKKVLIWLPLLNDRGL